MAVSDGELLLDQTFGTKVFEELGRDEKTKKIKRK